MTMNPNLLSTDSSKLGPRQGTRLGEREYYKDVFPDMPPRHPTNGHVLYLR